jgi:hypothetical protein
VLYVDAEVDMSALEVFPCALLALGLSAVVACSAPPESSFRSGTQPKPGDSAAPSFDPAKSDGAPVESGSTPTAGATVVFGHSADTLFRMDPTTRAVTTVGRFDCATDVTDLAVDAASNAWASSFQGLVRVDLTTARCTFVARGTYPNSLSFVPKGALDPNAEALVGYDGDRYLRIDPQTGATREIGRLGGGYESSGDVVAVEGGGAFLTAKRAGCNDCLLQIDPKTGAMVQDYGPVGRADVFGLAFWGGRLYGFSDAGELFEIAVASGRVAIKPIAIPSAPASLQFWGAGSTTTAPVKADDGTSIPIIVR